jgi:hypothetical protein
VDVGEATGIGVEQDPRAAGPAGRLGDAGGGGALGDQTAGFAARQKAQILEAADRQMRKACPWQRTGGVVDHQMIDVVVGGAGLGKGLGASHAERARGREILHLADYRRLDTLAGAEDVDWLLREILRALGRDQNNAPPPSVIRKHCNSRNGWAIIRELSTSSTVIGVLRVAREFSPPIHPA